MNVADKTYDPTPARRIACIGLGTMGAPMAAHLQRSGHTVTVFERADRHVAIVGAAVDRVVGVAAGEQIGAARRRFAVVDAPGFFRETRADVFGACHQLAHSLQPGSLHLFHTRLRGQRRRFGGGG